MRDNYSLLRGYGRRNFRRGMFGRYAWGVMLEDTGTDLRCLLTGHKRVGTNEWCQRCYQRVTPGS